ncbi:MAG TPA: hypothetical protein VFP19_01045 [Candidatus Limnocylindrales bacterium]|nr:hypothetical protein [Candidatus Limnocylindrales bacterium]
MTRTSGRLAIAIEAGDKRVFASALEWPGWARSARSEEAAVASLLSYAPRYAPVARAAGLEFPEAFDADVIERDGAGSGTDFGVVSLPAAGDRRPTSAAEANRLAALVAAAWAEFDRVAAAAPPELRKGPRGGGRDRDKIVGHVNGADAMYAGVIGLKVREPEPGDHAAVEAIRSAVLEVLRTPSDGSPLAGKKWPARYAARRIAWHALDHAWEIQDRSAP